MITYSRYWSTFIDKGRSVSSKFDSLVGKVTNCVRFISENKSSTKLQNDIGQLFPEGKLVVQSILGKFRSPPTQIVAVGLLWAMPSIS